ncbi:MAG TPA: SUMF1/EgtB/PvdO family nonheme iron enzyme, partial [Myxococcota bacterium]|nr:SUMF1/EgtB/PvdO family nonheme iron enzyme [Myxococcota bacterium]
MVVLICGTSSGCDDDVPSSETGAMCFDGRDNDADGREDCADRDCEEACVESSCHDGVDEDRDGATDCLDDDCRGRELCFCTDGFDNDADGRVDCVDTDCDQLEACDAPQGMRVLFGRSFTKGCGNPRWPQSQPSHSVTVPDFLIDAEPTNVGDFRRCVQAGACEALMSYEDGWDCTYGDETAPSVPLRCATWEQADAYCRWRGQRLCSESEWELAFRFGGYA